MMSCYKSKHSKSFANEMKKIFLSMLMMQTNFATGLIDMTSKCVDHIKNNDFEIIHTLFALTNRFAKNLKE